MTADPTLQTTPPRSTTGARETITVLLMLGAVVLLLVPFGLFWATITWAIGAGLLWSSDAWDTRDKALGTLIWPGGLIGPVLLSLATGQVCTTVLEGRPGAPVGEPVCSGFAFDPWIGIPLAIVVFAAPILVGSRLLRRAGRA